MPDDPAFPAGLDALPRPCAGLWALGRGCTRRPWVAVVGARAADAAALLATQEIAELLAGLGLGLLSGGALGVDAAAHWAALQAGGPTAAVLAGGVDVPTPPRNRPLFREMLCGDGLLLAEQPPGSTPLAKAFPRRNELIAAMARAVVVVQARLGSGTMLTARQALRLGRPLLVVPGGWRDGLRSGCTTLLQQGGLPFTSPQELEHLLQGLGLGAAATGEATPAVAAAVPLAAGDTPALSTACHRLPPGATPAGDGDRAEPAEAVLAALQQGPATLEVLARRSGLSAPLLLARLTELELCGRLRALPGGVFAACAAAGGGVRG